MKTVINTLFFLTIILTAALTVMPGFTLAQEAVDIGSRRELFIDDFLIDTLDGASLELHHPTPKEIVIKHDEPWEGSGTGYHTIFPDGDTYRMYYKAWNLVITEDGLDIPHDTFTCYAESDDGINWEKPVTGLFEYNGSKENNIVWMGSGAHSFTPFKDTNPAAPADEKYKAVGAGGMGELFAFLSEDGIHWRRLSDEPVPIDGAFDSQNLVFFDTIRNEYRMYFRVFRDGSRDIMTCTSQDFRTWSEPVPLSYPGAPEEQLYTNQIKPYYRAPHIFIGFPARYVEREWKPRLYEQLPSFEHRSLRAEANPRYGSAITDGVLMTSRDSHTFKRWGEAFLRPGLRSAHQWAYGDNYIAWHVIETKPDMAAAPNELSLYATESYWTNHESYLRRYTLRIDGFVSASAPLSGGELITKPFIFSGDTLSINMATSAAGNIFVEIQDETGAPLEGFEAENCLEIFGDNLDRIVLWQHGSDLTALAGTPVRLRFIIRDADVFSFQFK